MMDTRITRWFLFAVRVFIVVFVLWILRPYSFGRLVVKGHVTTLYSKNFYGTITYTETLNWIIIVIFTYRESFLSQKVGFPGCSRSLSLYASWDSSRYRESCHCFRVLYKWFLSIYSKVDFLYSIRKIKGASHYIGT